MSVRRFLTVALGTLLVLAANSQAQTVVRVGAFPNLTHAQAMVGKALGWFEKAMGPQVKVEWRGFNAGPSAVEVVTLRRDSVLTSKGKLK